MFKEIKSSYGVGVLELGTIISFVVLSFVVLYKYSLYSGLGIPWYINSLSAFSVFLASLGLIFLTVLATLIGGLLALIPLYKIEIVDNLLLKNWKNILYLLLSSSSLTILLIILILVKDTDFFRNYFFFNTYESVYIVYIASISYIFTIGFFWRNLKWEYYIDFKGLRVIFMGSIIGYIIVMPIFFGYLEARYILNNNFENLNQVEIKDNDSNKWYLVDILNDKALVANKSNESSFKIVEYKDVKRIIVKPSKSELMLNKLK